MSNVEVKSGRVLAKVLCVGVAGLTLMGNTKCEKKAAVPPRSLKKIVQMGTIASSPLIIPGGTFDFGFVANQQIYGVLTENSHFALKSSSTVIVPPSSTTSNPTDDVTKMSNPYKLSANDTKAITGFAQAAGKDNYSVEYSQTAWCMVNLPQTRISGAINAFELLGGGGLKLGYSPTGTSAIDGAAIDMQVEYSQLDVSMAAYRPLTNNLMAAVNVDSKQTKTKVDFNINFGMFSVGPSYYYQTPLAAVTKKALSSSIDKLDSALVKEEWFTRVLANHDTHLVIVGGTDLNLEPGDQLLVYNEDYYWEGEPCNSKYIGGGAAAGNAVAKIEIDWVGDEISRGKIIEQNDYNAVVGAKVKLFKMHAADYKPADPGVMPATSSTLAVK